jgi:D-cysteine desulfhydrase family pyridoxal phosphate-dependent enzyme
MDESMNKIPRLKFANLPTPIEEMSRLAEFLKGPQLLIKRDDLTGLAFGGNKTRKLEFLIADALKEGAQTLVTTGALQSNHCRQTAAAAAKFGFGCTLVLVGEPPEHASGNLLLNELFGAQIIWTDKDHREENLQKACRIAEVKGEKPYLVPYGGSNPIGISAYVYAVEEVVKQGIKADWVIFASSSGGTQAGLELGSRVFGFQSKILGISVDEPQDAVQERVASLANDTGKLLGIQTIIQPEDVLVNDVYAAPGYGVLTESEREAIHLFADMEGVLLDPVYTGRAGAGLIDLIRRNLFKKTDTVLFWHTGGQPALFAEKYQSDLNP